MTAWALTQEKRDCIADLCFTEKNIVIPQTDEGKKFILEFEAVRQSVYLYVNGNMAGYYEAGITAMEFDITPYVAAGEENIIAVATDNNSDRGQDNKFIEADGKEKVKVTMETIPGHEPGDASALAISGIQKTLTKFRAVLAEM